MCGYIFKRQELWRVELVHVLYLALAIVSEVQFSLKAAKLNLSRRPVHSFVLFIINN